MQFADLKAQYAALQPAIDARIRRVLDHGQYILGPEVAELEAALAAYTGARHCIGVASGTDALLIALMVLGIGRGDEVVTTAFSFAATAEVVVLAGATPVFVDVEGDTGNIDATRLDAAITPRTKAILPVGLYGQPSDHAAIGAVAARHGLAVVEDAAQSFGATCGGRRSGALSTVGATSFFPSKPLGAYGDGGALFTDDDAIAQAAREIRVHGQSARYAHTRIGVAGRLDTLQAAILLAKLERFPWELERRAALAARYRERLADVRGVTLLAERAGRASAHAQFTVLVDGRAAVQAALARDGVPTAVHYPCALHRQPAYAAYAAADAFPVARRLAERVLSLPMSADLTEADQDRVVAALRRALG